MELVQKMAISTSYSIEANYDSKWTKQFLCTINELSTGELWGKEAILSKLQHKTSEDQVIFNENNIFYKIY